MRSGPLILGPLDLNRWFHVSWISSLLCRDPPPSSAVSLHRKDPMLSASTWRARRWSWITQSKHEEGESKRGSSQYSGGFRRFRSRLQARLVAVALFQRDEHDGALNFSNGWKERENRRREVQGFFDPVFYSGHDMASHQWRRLCLNIGDVSVVFVSTDELR